MDLFSIETVKTNLVAAKKRVMAAVDNASARARSIKGACAVPESAKTILREQAAVIARSAIRLATGARINKDGDVFVLSSGGQELGRFDSILRAARYIRKYGLVKNEMALWDSLSKHLERL